MHVTPTGCSHLERDYTSLSIQWSSTRSRMVVIQEETGFSGLLQKRFNDAEYCDVLIAADDGTKFYAAKYALRCGSEVFHKMLCNNMKEKNTGRIHIRDADSESIKVMLVFMHGGKCSLDSCNWLPIMSIAQRYQVNHLISVCTSFQSHHFQVNSTNCYRILEQSYKFPETPQNLRQECQRVIQQNIAQHQINSTEGRGFLSLSFPIVHDIALSALPHMFLDEPFPATYVNLAEAILEWLDHDPSSRQPKAMNLLSCMEFEALGLEGIVKITSREIPRKNWVRCYPMLEQKTLNALSLAHKKPTKHVASKLLPCQHGRWTFVCRGGCSKKGRGATVMATFDIEEGTSAYAYFSSHGHLGCTLSITCGGNVKHVLLAAGGGGGTDAEFCKCNPHTKEKPSGASKRTCCKFGQDAQAGWTLAQCHGTAQSGGLSYVHPLAVDLVQCWTPGQQSSITIFSRPPLPAPK